MGLCSRSNTDAVYLVRVDNSAASPRRASGVDSVDPGILNVTSRAGRASDLSKPLGMRRCHPGLVIKRVVAYADADDLAASRDFYVEVLGFQVAMEDPILGITSPANPTAQVLIPPRGMQNPPPRFGVDLGDPDAVDAAHAEVVRRGLRVVYPLTNEPWGVRRFFVQDPGGTVVNVLAHLS